MYLINFQEMKTPFLDFPETIVDVKDNKDISISAAVYNNKT